METLSVTVKRATQITGLGKTSIYKAMKENRLAFVKVGRRTLIPADSLRELVEAA